jgi:[ribosomal protein S5]-alanine N-acetyltransferase
MHKTLTTERLHLRPMDVQDANFILKLVNSPGWLRFIGDRNINSQADAEQYIRKIIDTPQYFYHVFSLKTTGEPLGILTFLHRANQKHPDIGFAILPHFEQQGLAFEATQKYLAEIILAKPSYQKIIGITLPDNLSSIALLEKLGLKFEHHYTENDELLSQYGIDF